ncbi:hypothetical protein A2U01_0065564, partial [Trifolium medium]|nr:hypothetical protein [Trifolium medium]
MSHHFDCGNKGFWVHYEVMAQLVGFIPISSTTVDMTE